MTSYNLKDIWNRSPVELMAICMNESSYSEDGDLLKLKFDVACYLLHYNLMDEYDTDLVINPKFKTILLSAKHISPSELYNFIDSQLNFNIIDYLGPSLFTHPVNDKQHTVPQQLPPGDPRYDYPRISSQKIPTISIHTYQEY